ncbi:MAG: hypothetical protein H6595_14475 [Flavobacteriales bacterium]|nr:hypothetical protein [Flavobacteriales bacterium]MCB9168673.1 hypothetical protein [Flavobacteriales bacterium]
MVRWLTPHVVIVLLGVLLLAMSNNINWGGPHWRSVLQVDARGYHAYLPALLLRQDPNLNFFDELEKGKYGGTGQVYDYRIRVDDRTVNKYFIGTALCESPFFLAAHAWTLLTNGDADGFAKPYVVAVNIAAIFFVLLGLWAIDDLLLCEGIDAGWRSTVVVAMLLGTPLVYYSVVAPGMSHAYSFGLCSLFVRNILRWSDGPLRWRLLVLGALLGLIVLVRPVNALILITVPLFLGSWARVRTFLDRTVRQGPWTLMAMVLFAGVVGIQALYYHAATGKWWVDTYPGEGFVWSDPHILDMLFSYRKGLFVYSPVLLLATAGLVPMARRSVLRTGAWITVFLGITYVLSSWWNWWYGGSFGQRAWSEYLVLFALPLAYALQHSTGHWRKLLLTSIGLLLVLCQFQIYQARYYMIHWEDMNRTRYWEVFLKVPHDALDEAGR